VDFGNSLKHAVGNGADCKSLENMKTEPYYIYHVTAWSTGINSPYSEYVIETEKSIQANLDGFDRDIFDDGVQAVVETTGFESFQEAENYLLEYYQN